ncbi:MAG: radical SAM/SPASM domain-containing protein, partial [Alphaproteobacteria bacterium]
MPAYGFDSYLTVEFPSQINVDVTEFCNLACVHCPYEQVTRIKGAKRVHLDEALHAKLIGEIAAEGGGRCNYLRYTGDGEPLLHPRLSALLADAAARSGIQVALTTNGLLLDEERTNALLDAGVSVFDVSLDAHTPETYAQVRVHGTLSLAIANVRGLIAANAKRGRPARIMVSFVVQLLNRHEAEAFDAFWKSEGVDFVVLRRQHSCAGEMSAVATAMRAAAPSPRTPCLYPWERLVLKPDGSVVFCPADWHHEGAVGHLASETIRDIWTGPKMQALRRAHLGNDFSSHHLCGQCPDWQAIHWPWQGRSYASVMREFAD